MSVLIRHCTAALAALFIWGGCIDTSSNNNPPVATAQNAAACDECHPFPGSDRCKLDEIETVTGTKTQCIQCHVGSIQKDSSTISGQATKKFHDAVFTPNDQSWPMTDSGHTNGTVDVRYGQCTRCHSYPPSEGQHRKHVTEENKSCFECHFASVEHYAVNDTFLGQVYPRIAQRMTRSLSGSQIPIAEEPPHRNDSTDVVFRLKEIATGTQDHYRWASAEKNCYNIGCHGDTAEDLYAKSSWR